MRIKEQETRLILHEHDDDDDDFLRINLYKYIKHVKVKKSYYRSRETLRGLQETEAPRFQDNRHMKVVRLSTLRTGRLYPIGNIPGRLRLKCDGTRAETGFAY